MLLIVVVDDEDDEDELDPLTPDPLDPWPRKPPLVVLVLVVVGVDDDVAALAVVPMDGRRVATSPPNTLKATMAPTTRVCLSR